MMRFPPKTNDPYIRHNVFRPVYMFVRPFVTLRPAPLDSETERLLKIAYYKDNFMYIYFFLIKKKKSPITVFA